MMSLRRILGLMLLFLFFEAVVIVGAKFLRPATDIFTACLAMTGLALGTWAIFYLFVRLLSHRPQKTSPQPPPAVPVRPRPPIAGEGFIDDFKSLVADADRRLAGIAPIDSKRSTPTVTSLPHFLVLGAEGSGKTSIIVNCGLDPILVAGEAERDGAIVPTAAGNIWYVKHGFVFIEIAGRHLQDSGRWEQVLQMLGRRPRLPWWKRLVSGAPRRNPNLRGVILACEASNFVKAQDAVRPGTIARTLNDRLQTIHAVIRPGVPAYVIFSKCDAIPYFQEFFSRLGEPEARRIVGASLPDDDPNQVAGAYAEHQGKRVTKLFNRLYQSLASKRLLLVARQDTLEERARAYEFPRKFKKIREDLVTFLVDVFRPSGLSAPGRFRGFYFCGKRLVARARVHDPGETVVLTDTAAMRRSVDATEFFRVEHRAATQDYPSYVRSAGESTTQKWAFLAGVFEEVILRDPAGVPRVQSPGLLETRAANIAFAAAGALALLMSIAWVFSWEKNHRLLSDAMAAVSATRPYVQPTPAETLLDLEALRPSMVMLNSYNRGASPLGYHWGLYSGRRAAAILDHLYYARFRSAILNPTLEKMSAEFLALQHDSPVSDDIYKDLKIYRTLTSGACKADEAQVSSTILSFWSDAVSRNPESMAMAKQQIQFYAGELKIANPYDATIPENGDAVQGAQTYLHSLTGKDQILQALLNQARDVPGANLSTFATNANQVLTGPDQIEGPYTREGWQRVEESIRDHKVVSSGGEACVVGNGPGAEGWGDDASMDSQVHSLYNQSYIDAWKQFLAGHHVIPFSSAADAAQKLRTLADNNHSPLLALMYMTSANTNVAVPQGLSDRLRAWYEHNVGPNVPNQGNPGTDPPSETVVSAFDSVHAMVDPTKANIWVNPLNQGYIHALGDLSDALPSLPQMVHQDIQPEMDQLKQVKTAIAAANTALNTLAGSFPSTASGIDHVVERLLREPIDAAQHLVNSVRVIPPQPLQPVRGEGSPPRPTGPDPKVIKATIDAVNTAAAKLCATQQALQGKFPFDAYASTDITIAELNQLLKPGTGQFFVFAHEGDVSKTYNQDQRGIIWTRKAEFPATFSDPFLATLNGFGELEQELYGASANGPAFKFTLTLAGTGNIPYDLEVDGQVMRFKPGHQTQPLQLDWPPLNNSPTRLIVHNGAQHGSMTAGEFTGPWSLFHLLQIADVANNGTFVFQTVRFAHGLNPLMSDRGKPGTIQIKVTSAAANLFNPGYFSSLRCSDAWALQPQPQTP